MHIITKGTGLPRFCVGAKLSWFTGIWTRIQRICLHDWIPRYDCGCWNVVSML